MQSRQALYATEDRGRENREKEKTATIRQWIVIGFILLAAIGNAGCNTFIQQTVDVMEGGPERRIMQAEQRQQEAIDKQMRLRQSRRELERQLAMEERKISEMRDRLDEQNKKIRRARERNRISAAEEERLKRLVAALDNEMQSLELKIQVNKLSGESNEDADELRKKLQALKAKEKRIEEEIKALEQ